MRIRVEVRDVQGIVFCKVIVAQGAGRVLMDTWHVRKFVPHRRGNFRNDIYDILVWVRHFVGSVPRVIAREQNEVRVGKNLSSSLCARAMKCTCALLLHTVRRHGYQDNTLFRDRRPYVL